MVKRMRNIKIKGISNKSKEKSYFELAEKLYEKRKYKIAEKFYRKTIKLNPKNDNCYIKIGFCGINNILNTDFFKPKNSLLNRISLINNIRLFDIAYNINNSENN
ncbi:tetratricopeptide repeat protein, partial [Candidatus Gracilibacteria bacterium]|nr:tetratricopeptide repeat protein [Candidatus Gracilibacteria bacterium]